jgi:hypothetical protein
MVAMALLRSLLTVAVLLAVYFAAPLEPRLDAANLALLVAALAGLGVLAVRQIRSVARSPAPSIRAVEALSVSAPLLVLVFATTYVLVSASTPAAFTEPLTRVDALYFATTVFSTVGFGDIAPVAESARLLVVGQIAVDLVVIGVGIRAFVAAVRIGRERASGAGRASSPEVGDDGAGGAGNTRPDPSGRNA